MRLLLRVLDRHRALTGSASAGAYYFEPKNRSRTTAYHCAASSSVLPAIESLISSMAGLLMSPPETADDVEPCKPDFKRRIDGADLPPDSETSLQ